MLAWIAAGLRDWRTTVPAALLAAALVAVPPEWWHALALRIGAAGEVVQALSAAVPLVLALWRSTHDQ